MPQTAYNFQDFVQIVEKLRGPEGCPWDKKQTHQTLIRWAIEESHELAEAIEENNSNEIKSELGDLLLQVVLHSEIARQDNNFNIKDVIQTISEKMVRRHPHVFDDLDANLEEVHENWENIKAKENKKKRPGFNISKTLSPLLVSQKIGEKTKAQKFDWSNTEEVQEKVLEEISEFKEAQAEKNKNHMEEEFGDILFSLVQLGRHMNIEAEQALRKANSKFEKRYLAMKELIEQEGEDFLSLNQLEKDEYWKRIK
ncbi:MAG: nucleoside triphosphate pyrophosphohydrolase [Bdellovibrionaceae bacterium]|jgi:tetrapyrrole methylase family protein / MazG family protein|nr:nucleoside triphosphate pyrophosphohydrolase [Pseudobdellovibrionaceae bacterium]